jgi:septal ring factor EnvC (AmiA/AmiB activator)
MLFGAVSNRLFFVDMTTDKRDVGGEGVEFDSVRGEKRIHLAAIIELETASAQLQTLLNRLEREIREKAKAEVFIPAGKGFGTFRGKLAFPVEGRILSTFGKNENPKFNTFTVQKGIEIEAAIGAEIRAVYDGRVLYSDWFKGYGKILIIDHGEGYYTLSGHASALLKNVGEEVRGGEGVALVGDTGSLKGPCLYFEIRQRGKPLDPLEWLAHPRVR